MIYICIPTHNEQQTVGVVLWKLRQVFTEYPRDYQLLVADDASTDKTPEVLEPYTRVLPLTVIRSETRQGYAGSLEMLLREAVRRSEYPKRDVVVTLQADFSEEPDDLIALIKRMEAGADVAVGNKVSEERETRTRKFARTLAAFFARGQKWPEGVETPFDGYRAYRLYAVRRAMEERAGKRLLHYDGWAGHAELLKAVLPHARRVDVVDVVDRCDRLQRPRREKPWAAAMQVRAMARQMEPAGLLPVEALDELAATASRSRERTTLASMQQARAASGNGRSRTHGTDRDRGRGRPPARQSGGERGGRGRGEGRPQEARGGPPTGERQRRPARNAEQGGEPRPPRQRSPRPAQPARQPTAATTAEQAVPEELTGILPAEGMEGQEAPKPKKRRRRRKKTGGAAAAAGQGTLELGDTSAEIPGDGAESASESAAEGENEAVGGTGERKKRRRGGRRGGRGRRRGPRPEGAPEGADPEGGSEPVQVAAPAPEPVHPDRPEGG